MEFEEYKPNARDYYGRTPVQYAAESGYSNVIEIFASMPDQAGSGYDSQISTDEISGAMIISWKSWHL